MPLTSHFWEGYLDLGSFYKAIPLNTPHSHFIQEDFNRWVQHIPFEDIHSEI